MADELIIDTAMAVIPKELTYTKSMYEELVTELKNELDHSKNKGRAYQELYGMYYCSLIGLIRAGALCTRVSGKDGFPEIRVYIKSKYFKIREDVIYSIIGADEADEIISPYEDHADTYVPHIERLVKDTAEKTEEENVITQSLSSASEKPVKQDASLKKEIESLKKEKKEIESKAKAKYDALDIKYRKALEANKNLPVVSSAEDAETISKFKDQIEKAAEDAEKLKQDLSEWKKKYHESQDLEKEAIKKAEKLQEKLDRKEEEARKYIYDPNYDHYYNDELPVIMENLEFNHTGTMVRVGAMIGCFIGVVSCLLMFI